LSIKRKRNSKEKKRNIKSRIIDKRKRKNISSYTYHNIYSAEIYFEELKATGQAFSKDFLIFKTAPVFFKLVLVVI